MVRNANHPTHRRNIMIRSVFACLAALALAVGAQADQGNPKVKSIDAITFGNDGLLIIADSKGSQVVTVETLFKEIEWTKTEIADIDQLIAGKLGLMAKDIQIIKMAVDPKSHMAVVAVRSLKAKQDVLLTITGSGADNVREFSLDNVTYHRYPVNTGEKAITAFTDVAFGGDRILVASNPTKGFENKVFSVVMGAKGEPCSTFSTETFHTGHNAIETKAPIRTIMAYEEGGKKYVIGTFTCTPIVRYPLDDMKPGAQLKGSSVVELGHGNTPRDMFVYEKDGKKYILMSCFRMGFMNKSNPVGPSPYWACKVDHNLLKETVKVDKDALWRFNPKSGKANKSETDRAQIAMDYFGVQFMSKLDNQRALVIREDKSGLQLRVLPLP
jgi:hypothetical protein